MRQILLASELLARCCRYRLCLRLTDSYPDPSCRAEGPGRHWPWPDRGVTPGAACAWDLSYRWPSRLARDGSPCNIRSAVSPTLALSRSYHSSTRCQTRRPRVLLLVSVAARRHWRADGVAVYLRMRAEHDTRPSSLARDTKKLPSLKRI